MFRAKTVFVLGAGASVEVGLPAGDKLLTDISQLIDIKYDRGSQFKSGDYCLSEALKLILDEGNSVDLYNEHLRSAWQIVSSSEQALSIDNIVDALNDEKIERMAKLGIVRAIYKAEENSTFFKSKDGFQNELNLNRFSDCWYSHFTKMLCEGVKISDVEKIFDNIQIINFNYDRCIERYIPHSLSNYYGTDLKKFQDILDSLTIHRPYGIAGVLKRSKLDQAGSNFGDNDSRTLARCVDQIRTFTQGIENPDTLASLREAVSSADRLIFLGFAFHRQNLELLKVENNPRVQVLSTAMVFRRVTDG